MLTAGWKESGRGLRGARPSSEEEAASGRGLPLCAAPHLAGPRRRPQVHTAPPWGQLASLVPWLGCLSSLVSQASRKMRPAPPGPVLLRGVAPRVDVRGEVGKREACDLAGLVLFTRSSRELSEPTCSNGAPRDFNPFVHSCRGWNTPEPAGDGSSWSHPLPSTLTENSSP